MKDPGVGRISFLRIFQELGNSLSFNQFIIASELCHLRQGEGRFRVIIIEIYKSSSSHPPVPLHTTYSYIFKHEAIDIHLIFCPT